MANQDLNLNDYQVVLNKNCSDLSGRSHETVQVTMSATLKCGSILDAAGAELALAAAATARYVIDDLTMRNLSGDLSNGATLDVACVARDCTLNQDVVVFSDGAVDAAGIAALEAFGNDFKTVASV